MKTYIDIHTHSKDEDDVLSVHNLYRQYEDSVNTPYCSIGIHPWYVNAPDIDSRFSTLTQFANRPNVLAIGECGLDKLSKTDWDVQVKVFGLQIELAKNINKPIIIHCVRAYNEVLKILKETGVKVPVIFHGFNKKWELAEQVLKQGYYLSFGAALLKEDAFVREVFANTPEGKFFLETDDSGADIKDLYQAVSVIRKTPVDALILQLQKNFETVFKR